MKTIKYVGDQSRKGEGPEIVRCYGKVWPKGSAVKCDDPGIVAKAEGNSHFLVEDVKIGRPKKQAVTGAAPGSGGGGGGGYDADGE